MLRVSRYIAYQLFPWLGLALLASALLFLSTQLLRVLPVFVGAGAGSAELLTAMGLLLVPVSAWALTPAFTVAVFAASGRMAADGELTALRACGLSRFNIALGPLVLAVIISLLSAWIWLDAAPRSQRQLRQLAIDLAGRAIAGQITAGTFVQPIAGVTVYAAEKRDDRIFRRVLIDDVRNPERQLQFVAQTADFRINGNSGILRADLGPGTVFSSTESSEDLFFALSYNELQLDLPLGRELEDRLSFLPEVMAEPTASLLEPTTENRAHVHRRYALWRRVAAPLGCLLMSLFSTLLAVSITWSNRGVAIALAAGLYLVFHLLGRLGESLAQAGHVSPPVAALIPAFFVASALLLVLLPRESLTSCL